MSSSRLAGLLLLTVTPILGQVSTPALFAVTETAESVEENRVLRDEILRRFTESKIGVNRFEVQVEGGVAVLTGSTSVGQHKGTATRLARLAGAKRVDNRIVMSGDAKQAARKSQKKKPRRVHVKRSEPQSAGARGKPRT